MPSLNLLLVLLALILWFGQYRGYRLFELKRFKVLAREQYKMNNLYAVQKIHGVLSINRRNTDFVFRYNPRKLFPLVDDKLKTKQLAIKIRNCGATII